VLLTSLVLLSAGLGAVVAVSPVMALAIAGLTLVAALHYNKVGLRAPRPEALLHLLVLSMFLESVGVGPLSLGRLLAAIAVVAVLARFALSRQHLPYNMGTKSLPVLALVAVYVASGLWADNTRAWLFALGQLALAVAFYLAFATLPSMARPADVVRPLLRTYVLGAVLAAGIGLAQIPSQSRAVGLQGDPNIYAMYQVAALPALVCLARIASGGRRALWLLASLPIAASVLASQSRGALVAMAPVLLVSVATMAPRRQRLRLGVAALLAMVLMGSIAAVTSARVDPTRVSTDRASGRIDIWYVAWHAFLDQPLTGIGSGNFVPRSVELLTSVPGVELVKSHLLESTGIEVHNLYLEALTERGVGGLAVLLWLLAATARGLARARSPNRPELDCLLPMLLAFAVAAFFLSIANNKLLWMLVGLSVLLPAGSTIHSRRTSEEYAR
jgi:O-antigen ligase